MKQRDLRSPAGLKIPPVEVINQLKWHVMGVLSSFGYEITAPFDFGPPPRDARPIMRGAIAKEV